jgi:integrase
VRHTRETFGGYWERWLARRRPYLEAGTWTGYEIVGRKRLVPAFDARSVGELSDDIREFVAELAEEVEVGELAAQTVNKALGTLVVCLNSAVDDGLIAVNPALRVQRLPPAHIERDYLRLDEIPRYVDACSDVYRPLAKLLIGTGLRISEALALRVSDLELEDSGGTVVVYRSQKSDAIGSTKSDRFRCVEIGPALCAVLRDQVARRGELATGDRATAVVFVVPVRTIKRSQGRCESAGAGQSLDRNTVSRDWHKNALEDAALRDTPLHALRHTAAAACSRPATRRCTCSASSGTRTSRVDGVVTPPSATLTGVAPSPTPKAVDVQPIRVEQATDPVLRRERGGEAFDPLLHLLGRDVRERRQVDPDDPCIVPLPAVGHDALPLAGLDHRRDSTIDATHDDGVDAGRALARVKFGVSPEVLPWFELNAPPTPQAARRP